MSFLGKLLGGRKEDNTPSTSDAIKKLRETEDMLIKKQEHLEKKVEAELSIAKANASKNKRLALQALKRKKRYEKQLQQIDGTLTTIESQREALEGANTNAAVLDSIKQGSDALKKSHKNMDIDQVHEMMDDISEQQEIAREIADAISNPVAFGHEVDDDDLDEELAQLEQEALNEELIKVGPTGVDLPSTVNDPIGEKIPARAPIATTKNSRKEEEDQDMKDLELWAS